MRVKASDLDTLITFQSAQRVKDPVYQTYSTIWADIATDPTVYAEFQEMLPSRGERVADGININRQPARVRCHYRDDITNAMRIVKDGVPYQIVGGPAELGRKDGLEMVVERISTEGEQP